MNADEELLKQLESDNPPDPIISITEPALARLAIAVRYRKQSEKDLDKAVRAAREEGFSWAAIADILGISRQGAQQRYKAA